MSEEKPLFPVNYRYVRAARCGWAWMWQTSKHRDRNVTPGSQIIVMELSENVSGGQWLVYIGAGDQDVGGATAHLFYYPHAREAWEKVAERDLQLHGSFRDDFLHVPPWRQV